MMKVTEKLRERFCKDMNIPIKLFEDPYFESRLKLYDAAYDTLAKYGVFLDTLSKFTAEQDYFETYNKLKDDVIEYLKSREGMQRFIAEDMNKFRVKNEGFPSHDIFKQTFDGKYFVSIDMKKANFTALRHYNASIVGNAETYEDFLGMFTKHEYFKSSKYIRQVVFGNLNPKRQVGYEKYLMDGVLTALLEFTPREDIVFFSNDEIVVVLDRYPTFDDRETYSHRLQMLLDDKQKEGVNLRQERFLLRHIPSTDGYIRRFENKPGYDFKCMDGFSMPFVLRAYAGEEVQEEDKVFRYEGMLAKIIDVPTVEVV